MNIEKFKKSPWAVSISVIIIIMLLVMIYDYFTGNPILTNVSEIISFVWNIIYGFLNINIKMWWLILAFGIFIFVLYLIIHFREKERNRNTKA